MSTRPRNDGVCFYGIVYEDFDEEGFSFDAHLNGLLGVKPYTEYLGIREYREARSAAWVARFGFDLNSNIIEWTGRTVRAVYIAETRHQRGVVPVDKVRDLELCARYLAAMNELAESLPGGSEPGWRFGCRVG